MSDRDRENQLIGLLVVLACLEFIISLITYNSTLNTLFWYFRIINSLSIIVLSFFLCDAQNHHYQDGAAPVLVILPCSIIIFIICEIGNLGIDISKIYLSLFSQNEHIHENIIYFLHLIILVLFFISFKKYK